MPIASERAAETYVGLVEVGVGIIPAGGGTKELLVRALDCNSKGATMLTHSRL
jgi:3-hydroxyacyl-CoA dehydrogenase